MALPALSCKAWLLSLGISGSTQAIAEGSPSFSLPSCCWRESFPSGPNPGSINNYCRLLLQEADMLDMALTRELPAGLVV